jgi:hypothetical protein
LKQTACETYVKPQTASIGRLLRAPLSDRAPDAVVKSGQCRQLDAERRFAHSDVALTDDH